MLLTPEFDGFVCYGSRPALWWTDIIRSEYNLGLLYLSMYTERVQQGSCLFIVSP